MFPRMRGATQADFEAAHGTHTRALRALARELDLPEPVAEELIDDALHAALLLRAEVDLGRWLAATLRAAARYRKGCGE